MPKIEPIRLPSDDCEFVIAGKTYHHKGEWVEYIPGLTVRETRSLYHFTQLAGEFAAVEGDPDERKKVLALLDPHYAEICEWLARRIVRWNWTDDDGEPFPQPHKAPDVLADLRAKELYYLLQVIQQDSPELRKNGSRPSRITSSASKTATSRA